MNRESLQKFYINLLGTLNGAQTSVNQMNTACFTPEQKAELDKFKASLNDKLKQLEPIDMVAGAREALWALEDLGRMFETLNGIQGAINQQCTCLNERVKTEADQLVQTRLNSGELVTKEKVQELVNAAKLDGAKEGRELATLHSGRRERILKAGLAMPSDEIIGAADFDTRLQSATTHGDELKKQNISLNGSYGPSVWLDEAGRKSTLEQITEAKGGTANKPPVSLNQKRINPLLGAGTGGGGAPGKYAHIAAA